MRPLVFDAGALIALERRNGRILALIREAIAQQETVHVPAGVVAQVWRGSPRQHPVIRLLRSKVIRIHPMDEPAAYRIGLLLGATSTSDVVDAHVAVLGRSLSATVLTSDPEDLRRLAPELTILEV